MNRALGHINIYDLQNKSITELTELVEKYPHFSLIRSILAHKSDLNKSKKIALAATYSSDRSYLYVQGPSSPQSSLSFIDENKTNDFVIEHNESASDPLKKKSKNRKKTKKVTSVSSINIDSNDSKFVRWARNLLPPKNIERQSMSIAIKVDVDEIEKGLKRPKRIVEKYKKRSKKRSSSKKKAIELAIESVKRDKTIVSQTLAIILENQKSYSEAIDMYKRLILKFPEKSAYFAKKIKKLNKKI